MATVVITFFLLTPLFCKMDADYQDRRRDHTTSRRKNRWSMYSQRLEEIVAELMKPISDIRRSFDTDLSALLEEYLTEAGLHALTASEEGDEHDAPVAPNFAELAILLQHSACLYGRKVDFLYQHVLSVSDSLHTNTQDTPAVSDETAEAATPNSARRRRRHSAVAAAEFAELELESSGGARREVESARPPPTLPRMYIELEPRVLSDSDLQLFDYVGEPIGLPADFYVTWRLQGGLLVDDLEGNRVVEEQVVLRPISLVELQAAIEAGAPINLPRIEPPGDEPPSPACASTPLPQEPPLPHEPLLEEPTLLKEPSQTEPPTPDLTSVVKRDRKRRSNINVDDILNGCFSMVIDAKVRRKLSKSQEFSISFEWIERVVAQRKSFILAQRKRLRAHVTLPPDRDFRGFDSSASDIGGFFGWSRSECEVAVAARLEVGVGAGGTTRLDPDSEDDGFFEQSSLGDSDDTHLNHSINITTSNVPEPCASWQERVVARATAAEARGSLDVGTLARAVLDACDSPTSSPRTSPPISHATPFTQVLRSAAVDERDVSRLLLATLFLANAGNVEIVQGSPLSVDSFSVRFVSRDQRLYSTAAAADEHFLR